MQRREKKRKIADFALNLKVAEWRKSGRTDKSETRPVSHN